MNQHPKIFAALELSALSFFWILAVWGNVFFHGASAWSGVGILGIVSIVIGSVWIRRPGWKNSGFRFDHFLPALGWAFGVTLAIVFLFVLFSKMTGLSFHPVSRPAAVLTQVTSYLVWGVLQESFFLGFLFHRWNALCENAEAAIVANALSFAFIHLPDPLFVTIAGVGGLLFTALFFRLRNVFAIGLAHGVLALFVISLFRSGGIIQSMGIGPAQLAPIARTIEREIKSGDRVGMGTHSIVPAQFGTFSHRHPIEKIVGRWDVDNDRLNRGYLDAFLKDSHRVFSVMTEKDFEHLVNLELQKQLFILDAQYIWKRKIKVSDLFQKMPQAENKDWPLRVFRDRVLLVSNQPARQN